MNKLDDLSCFIVFVFVFSFFYFYNRPTPISNNVIPFWFHDCCYYVGHALGSGGVTEISSGAKDGRRLYGHTQCITKNCIMAFCCCCVFLFTPLKTFFSAMANFFVRLIRSEDLEIERLRPPPLPPSRKGTKSKKSKKKWFVLGYFFFNTLIH